jgi:hypothetical protein
MYLTEGKSMKEVSLLLHCSVNQVSYWMRRYNIQSRSISAGVYARRNPTGDPFLVRYPKSVDDAVLYGIGLGLYWGEGTKSNKSSIRLGNTDPRLIKKFLAFLDSAYGIRKEKLHFGLQIFSDMSPRLALSFWQKELHADKSQFQKVIVTPSRGRGTYGKKIKHGVLTVYYNNKKLRDILCLAIEKL